MEFFQRRIEHGFSLIEILVSVTILSFIVISIYSLVDNSVTTKEIVVSEDNQYLQVQKALNRIGIDFSQIYSSSYYLLDKRGGKPTEEKIETYQIPSERFKKTFLTTQLKTRFIHEENDITFMTSSHRRKVEDERESHYSWVRYSIQRQEEERNHPDAQFILLRQSNPKNIYSRDHDWENAQNQILLRNIKSLSFNFWDSDKEDYVESFNQLSEHDQDSPKIMVVRIIWFNKNGEEYEFFRSYRSNWPIYNIPRSNN